MVGLLLDCISAGKMTATIQNLVIPTAKEEVAQKAREELEEIREQYEDKGNA